MYLCAVLDLCGKMVPAYRIGGDMTASLVTDTVRDACKKKAADGRILHSGQGSQYTSQAYFDLSQEYHSAVDVQPPGAFMTMLLFGTLKTECLYRRKFSCRAEIEQAVAEYVRFCNYERINLKNGLTPFEIRSKAV